MSEPMEAAEWKRLAEKCASKVQDISCDGSSLAQELPGDGREGGEGAMSNDKPWGEGVRNYLFVGTGEDAEQLTNVSDVCAGTAAITFRDQWGRYHQTNLPFHFVSKDRMLANLGSKPENTGHY